MQQRSAHRRVFGEEESLLAWLLTDARGGQGSNWRV